MSEIRSTVVDLVFALQGQALPREHRQALADALQQALPWLASQAGAGVHRLNVSAGEGPRALLSQRTRLTLRLPRHCVAQALALSGRGLQLAGQELQLGAAHERELLPHGALYAHFVAAASADELSFLQVVQAELQTLGVSARPICGRHQRAESGSLQGFGLMLDGLTREHALRVLESGLGPHRLWGCGLFVPHKSAVAVGTPD